MCYTVYNMICIVHIVQYVQHRAIRAVYELSRDMYDMYNITIWVLYGTQYSICIVHDIVYNIAYYIALI